MKYLAILGSMALSYGLIVANTRFIAAGSYIGTIGTDFVLAANGLFLIKTAVKTETWPERVAYICGGCLGSALSLWLTK